MPGPWSRVWDVECQGSARSRVPGQGWRWSQQWAHCHGEFNSQVELKQGHNKSSAPWAATAAGIALKGMQGLRRAAQLPFPPSQRLGHTRIPPDTSCLGNPSCNSSAPLWWDSKALAPLWPSGCPALTSLLGNRGFPERWHIRGRSFNPDPRICREG